MAEKSDVRIGRNSEEPVELVIKSNPKFQNTDLPIIEDLRTVDLRFLCYFVLSIPNSCLTKMAVVYALVFPL